MIVAIDGMARWRTQKCEYGADDDFWPKVEEMSGTWRKFHIEALDDLPSGDQIKEDAISEAWCAWRRRNIRNGFWLESLREWNQLEHLNVDVSITVNWIVKKEDGRVQTGVISLKIGIIGVLLWTW